MTRRIIGLTGGIATGKTTVANHLSTTHHLPVLDADLYAREAVAPDRPILKRIADRFGPTILLADGSLNRKHLGEIIFAHPSERLWLEQQIHPYVRHRFLQALHTPPLQDEQQFPTVLLVIPLLFEAGMTDLVTEIWVVGCPLDRQLERLMQRDRLTLGQAQNRIHSQMPLQEKLDRADVVLDNSSTLKDLLQQVDQAIVSASDLKIKFQEKTS